VKKRVCLLSVEAGEGPWIVSTGEESAVRAGPLKEGEQLVLEVTGLSGANVHFEGGLSRLALNPGLRYRFVKCVGEGVKVPSKTCAEVIFNG
jgi:hypothetical protein